MSFWQLQLWWTSQVAGPELLFTVRMATLLPVFLMSFMQWWEVLAPTSVTRQTRIWKVMTVMMAVLTALLAGYIVTSGFLERDRVGTPVRLLVANAITAPLYWLFFLTTVRRRVEHWARRAQGQVA